MIDNLKDVLKNTPKTKIVKNNMFFGVSLNSSGFVICKKCNITKEIYKVEITKDQLITFTEAKELKRSDFKNVTDSEYSFLETGLTPFEQKMSKV